MIVESAQERAILEEAGRILSETLDEIASLAKPGVRGEEIEAAARTLIERAGASPVFLGYKPVHAQTPYPAAICLSIASELVHGTPFGRVLRESEIVSLDCGIRYKGLIVDAARTFVLPPADRELLRLIASVKAAFAAALAQAIPGNRVGDVSSAVGRTIRSRGAQPITALAGHGVGRRLHEAPAIPNDGREGEGAILREGEVLAIEPMAAAGSGELIIAADGWTVQTRDGRATAHWEETIVVGNPPTVLTASKKNPFDQE